jgi:hypothetical protein
MLLHSLRASSFPPGTPSPLSSSSRTTRLSFRGRLVVNTKFSRKVARPAGDTRTGWLSIRWCFPKMTRASANTGGRCCCCVIKAKLLPLAPSPNGVDGRGPPAAAAGVGCRSSQSSLAAGAGGAAGRCHHQTGAPGVIEPTLPSAAAAPPPVGSSSKLPPPSENASAKAVLVPGRPGVGNPAMAWSASSSLGDAR